MSKATKQHEKIYIHIKKKTLIQTLKIGVILPILIYIALSVITSTDYMPNKMCWWMPGYIIWAVATGLGTIVFMIMFLFTNGKK